VASTEVVATWTELSRCPYVKEVKTIVHPGEVSSATIKTLNPLKGLKPPRTCYNGWLPY